MRVTYKSLDKRLKIKSVRLAKEFLFVHQPYLLLGQKTVLFPIKFTSSCSSPRHLWFLNILDFQALVDTFHLREGKNHLKQTTKDVHPEHSDNLPPAVGHICHHGNGGSCSQRPDFEGSGAD